MIRLRQAIQKAPRALRHGELAFAIDRSFVDQAREEALSISLITNRRLFGEFYSSLQREYFYQMAQGSGVFISPFVRTSDIIDGALRPGDIDLLIIPYANNELILERTLAVEVKAIRARFDRQSKSPNEFGYSQAAHLLELGFPYVAVAHLIVADRSPTDAWRSVMSAPILDEDWRVGEFETVNFDMLPASLIDRGFGRLLANCLLPDLGLVCAYIGEYDTLGTTDAQNGYWFPRGREANFNAKTSINLLQSIGNYFNRHPRRFFNTPRFDPI